jgi:hypothetical protein
MAKKITPNEGEAIEDTGSQSQTVEQPVPAPEVPQEQGQGEESPAQQVPAPAPAPEPTPVPEPKREKSPEPQESAAIPDYADRILKTFPAYPELYIDPQGGIYTTATPPAYRTNATLYTNPYHKRP